MREEELSGKVALVTGGSRGIGAAIALSLAELGADVAVTYSRSKASAEQVAVLIRAGGRHALAIKADSADSAEVVSAVEQTFEHLGGLDILVNCAGINRRAPIEAVSLEEVDRTLDTNTRGVYLATQAALRRMPDGGRIISIGSNLADRVPFSGLTLYAMSKAALIGLTKALAREIGGRRITVNLIQPGPTNTDMNPEDGPTGELARSTTALGRHASTQEIADAVTFLAGPRATNITGVALTVDGGSNA